MKPVRLLAAVTALGVMASPSLAAVRPAVVANLDSAQLGTGARLGATTAVHRSKMSGAGVPLAILAVAAGGLGVAAGVGAFDHNHHVSP